MSNTHDQLPRDRRINARRWYLVLGFALAALLVWMAWRSGRSASVTSPATHPPQQSPAPAPPPVVRGHQGWLYYAPDLNHVRGNAFDRTKPVAAIVDLRKQLLSRGIELLVFPVPSKPTVCSAMLGPDSVTAPRRNPSHQHFLEDLHRAGVLVMDPTDDLVEASRSGEPPFLVTDTHWRPSAVDRVAQRLARFIDQRVGLSQSLPVRYTRRDVTIDGIGDLADLLRHEQAPRPERVTIQPVSQPDGTPWTLRRDAEILLLGDSFSTIYASDPMGWGAGAGLVEQLSFHLHRPVDAIRRNDAGSLTNRQMLAAQLARGDDRLAGKKLVIWQFAERELSFGDWTPVELPPPGRPTTRQVGATFIVPPPQTTWRIEGSVATMGEVPATPHVAYRDHIVAVHLTDVSVEDPPRKSAQAVVYLRTMIDARFTPAARLKPGQRIGLQIRDWRDVSRQYELIRLSNLPDPHLRTQPACWGELN